MPNDAWGQRESLKPGAGRMEAEGAQPHHGYRSQQPAPHEPVEGQREDVKPYVLVPDGILGPEGHLVQESQDRLPLPGGDAGEDEPQEKHRQPGEDYAGRSRHALPDADGRQPPAGSERHRRVDAGEGPENDSKDKKRQQLGPEPSAKDAPEPQRAKPEPVRVDGGKRLEQEQQQQDDQHDPADQEGREPDGRERRLGRHAPNRGFLRVEEPRREAAAAPSHAAPPPEWRSGP